MTIQDAELEAIIWCPKCAAEKYEIRRIPVGNGVYTHASVPPGRNEKLCECGTPLERKP